MPRPVWSGSLSFGLVNVGVGLYAATEVRRVSFHQFEAGTNKRVRNRRVAEGTDREVEYSDVVKGYPTGDGEHVIVTQEELESVEPETSRAISIQEFVAVEEIDPIYYQRSYYLGPRDEGSEHPYALLREAMRRSGLAGVATFVMRNKQYLAVIRATSDVIVLSTMLFADAVRDPRQAVDSLPGKHELPKRELDSAARLIDQLATSWDPERYHDTYRESVLELIKQKASGEEASVEAPAETEEKVVDLTAALEQSIERERSRRTNGREKQTSRKRGRRAGTDEELDALTKKQLYDRAGELGISGRSKLSRDELLDALKKAL